MVRSSENIIYYNRDLVQRIFDGKESFHREQALLPIEEKIKILIKLQKIVLKTRQVISPLDNRRVWEL